MSEQWLSAAESAALTGRSADAWRQLVKRSEELRATRRAVGARTYLYRRDVVETYASAVRAPED